MINIFVNGKKENIDSISIKQYLESKDIDLDSIIILLNEEIIKKDIIDSTILKDNDSLEIVKFVGGG
ncbi:MAG TPA: sulfur carrier protein ThiS [Spirochaetota bacterium]|nr:sulfur carrier protein ThiS [Spirochaetota bacterium]HPP03532.1 sulfur carrier protein ThiS [Spirochaetota bacterium]